MAENGPHENGTTTEGDKKHRDATDGDNGIPEFPQELQLKCPVCQEEYNNPKILPCLHTYCEDCLENSLRQSNIQNGQSFLCPLCRHECVVPSSGVGALKTNVFFETMQEFEDRKTMQEGQECEACDSGARAKRKCVECDDWLCSSCCNMHRKVKVTKDHHIVSRSELKGSEVDGLVKESFEPLTCSVHDEPLKLYCADPACKAPICTVCKTTMGHDNHQAIPLDTQANREANEISQMMAQLAKSTVKCKSKINNLKHEEKLTSHVRKKIHKAIDTRLEQVVEKLMKQFGEYAEELHTAVEVMCKDHRKDIAKELEESKYKLQAMNTTQVFTKSLLEFNRAEELVFMAKEVKSRLSDFQVPPSTDPPSWRQPRIDPPSEVEGSVIAKAFGQLTFEGEIVKTMLVTSWSAKLHDDEKDCALCDVSINSEHNLVLVDRENKRIKIFTPKGEFLESHGKSTLHSPNRITVLKSSGYFLIKDEKWLKVLQPDGTYAGTFGADSLKQPVGVTQTKDGEVLITDWMSGAIHGFSEKGDHMRSFLCACEAAGYICSLPNGNIVVSDWKQHLVKFFDSTGKFVAQYGGHGNRRGQLDHPYGVCADKYGHVLVADTWNNRVHMLSSEGKLINMVATELEGLHWPQAVVVDKHGMLLVVEQSGMVKVFQYLA